MFELCRVIVNTWALVPTAGKLAWPRGVPLQLAQPSNLISFTIRMPPAEFWINPRRVVGAAVGIEAAADAAGPGVGAGKLDGRLNGVVGPVGAETGVAVAGGVARAQQLAVGNAPHTDLLDPWREGGRTRRPDEIIGKQVTAGNRQRGDGPDIGVCLRITRAIGEGVRACETVIGRVGEAAVVIEREAAIGCAGHLRRGEASSAGAEVIVAQDSRRGDVQCSSLRGDEAVV